MNIQSFKKKHLLGLMLAVVSFVIFVSNSTFAVPEPFCPGGSSPDPSVLFCENWDQGNPPAEFPNTRGTSWNGWTVGNYDTGGFADLSTAVYHSGTRSLYKLKKAGEYSVPDLIRTFNSGSEIRIRFYVYFDSDYANINTANEDIVHLILLQSGLSGRGVRMDIRPYVNRTGATPITDLVYRWPPTCVGNPPTYTPAFLSIGSPSGYGSSFKGVTQSMSDKCFDIKANLNKWILVEWAYKIVNVNEGRVSLWIDGVERMRDELLPPDPNYLTIDNMILSGFMSTLRDYSVGFYIDDIVVAKDYNFVIGPTTAPVITSVSGDLTHNSVVTITGRGFGMKDIAKPLVWADFESGFQPSPLGIQTDWQGVGSMGWSPEGFTGKGAKSTAPCGACTLGVDYDSWTRDGQKIYIYRRTKMDFLITDGSQNWKSWRMWPAAGSYPNIYAAPSNGRVFVEGIGQESGFWGDFRVPTTDWVTEEFIVKASTINTKDGLLTIRYNGQQVALGTIMTRSDAAPAPMTRHYAVHAVTANREFWTPAYPSQGITYWADDVYVDTSWARVMLCEAATYSACKDLSIQIPSAWSDTSITITVNQGTLADQSSAYLYVIDNNGNVNTEGFPVTVGGKTISSTITSVSGNFTNGSSVTISGSNFGSKPQSQPVIWDNFESGIPDTVLNADPQVGTWLKDSRPPAIYSTSQAHSGTQSSYAAYDGANQWSQFVVNPLPIADKFYQSFWFRYNTTGTNGQLKIMQVHGDSGLGDFAPGIMTGSSGVDWWFSYISTESGANDLSTRANYPIIPSQNTWHHFEMILKRSSAGNAPDGIIIIKVDNRVVYEKMNTITREGSTNNWDEISFFHGVTNMGGNTDVFVDDAYLDDSWSRVILADGPIYNNITHREIQIPSAWSANSITITANQGSFTDGQTAYLYAVDADGNVNKNGYPVTIGGPSPLPGNVNCDTKVDILDIQALVNCILGTGSCDWGCGNSADVNNDRFVDVLDVQCVVNIILCGICEGGC